MKFLLSLINKDRIFWLFAFLVLTLLFFLTPMMVDDFTFQASWRYINSWEDFISINSHFYNHVNGRVLGNLSSLVLADFKVLSSLIRAFIVVGIVYLVSIELRVNRSIGRMFLLTLIVFVPVGIFSETISWRAGFYNYVTPLLLILLLLALYRRWRVERRNIIVLGAFFISLAACLFTENTTIAILLSSLLVLAKGGLDKNRDMSRYASTVLLGAVLGTFVMFSSPVYGSVASGDDGYRSIATSGDSSFIMSVLTGMNSVVDGIFVDNAVYVLFFSLMVIIVLFFSNQKRRLSVATATTILAAVLVMLMYNKVEPDGDSESLFDVAMILLKIVTAAIYVASISVAVFIGVNSKTVRLQLLMYGIFFVGLLAPLVVVEPVSPRLFYIPYILIVLVFVRLAVYVPETYGGRARSIIGQLRISIDSVKMVGVTISLFMFGVLLCAYGAIAIRELENNISAKQQIDTGSKVIELKQYPFNNILYKDKYKSAWPRMHYAECECKYRHCNPCEKLIIRYK